MDTEGERESISSSPSRSSQSGPQGGQGSGRRYTRLPQIQRKIVSVVLGGYAVLLVNSIFLLLFDRSTALVYMSNVLLHICLGILLIAPAVAFLVMHLMKMPIRMNRRATRAGVFTALSLTTLFVTGIALVVVGSSYRWIMWTHIVTAVTSVGGFVLHVSLKRGVRYHFLQWGDLWKQGLGAALRHPLSLTALGGAVLVAGFIVVPWATTRTGVYVQEAPPGEAAPEETDAEGAVPGYAAALTAAPFAQSQSVIVGEERLPDEALAGSARCGQEGCHPDMYTQWSESMHRFSSFNNPWYEKSVEAMIAETGAEPARWCASCHDPVVLFAGRFDEAPVDADHWTAHEGITCLSCHAVEGLRDVRGNGRYAIALPDEYPFARAEEGLGRWVHNVLVRAKPEPHRRAMLKPVHRTPEFCGTCHKVGIPPEVNNYRWKRGQDEYDNWHNSGVSGNIVRSFYLPEAPSNCVSCHMPLEPSSDMGNDGGFIRSHRFAAANTAVPFVNEHPTQLAEAQENLSKGIALIDIFRVRVNGRTYGPDRSLPALRAGDRVQVDVVVRNKGVGHTLPGGTNDSNELWVEFLTQDASGETLLASGLLDAAGRVDSTAHFLGSVLVDRQSRIIDRRNVQDWVTNVYANVIGPGAARNVHYDFVVPPGAGITSLKAKLRHRKFKWYLNEWTFRGVQYGADMEGGYGDVSGGDAPGGYPWVLDPDKTAPVLPLTDMAADERRAGGATPDSLSFASSRPLWERWNDFGIGRLLETDTRGAIEAFERVAELAPDNPEGPINMARSFIEEGQLDRATEALREAERRSPGYLKTAWLRGEVHKATAEYDEALDEWLAVEDAYPEDRVLLLGIGRIHYLAGRYEEALPWFDRVLTIDPENVGALYNRMLALGALGRTEAFGEARERYEYHKDDENARAVASPYKQAHPMDNREAQALHEHGLHPVRYQSTGY